MVDTIQKGNGVTLDIEDIFQYIKKIAPKPDDDIILEYLGAVANECIGREPVHHNHLIEMLSCLGIIDENATYVDLDVHSMLSDRIIQQVGSLDYDHLHEFYLFVAHSFFTLLYIMRHKEGLC